MLWRVRLWDRFCVIAPDGVEYRPASRKTVEMLAYLALRRNPLVPRDALAEALWPDIDSVTARNRLKQTLATLRKEVPGLPIHVHGKHEIEFPFDEIRVDVRELAERARWVSILNGPARRDAVAQLLVATEGDLLEGFDTPWARAQREEWRTRRRDWTDELSNVTAIGTGFRFIDDFPLLSVDLLGREAELNLIREWFERSTERNLCIVGPPGVGKTRLMRAFFEQPSAPFDALLAVSTSQAFETNWTDRLSGPLGAVNGVAMRKRIVTLLLGFERPLLAIDDLDQAPAEMRSWIEELGGAVPRLRILSTARRKPLGGRARVLELAGLAIEEASDLLCRFALHAGVSEKALLRRPEDVRDLAKRFEGHPLSLEVAAGWLSFLSPTNLRERLDSSPEMLIDQAPLAGRSLAESVWLLTEDLSEAEREAMLTIAVCHGGLGERLAERLLGERWPWLIRRLAERSLIYSLPGNGGPRYAMLQALRETVRHLAPPSEVRGLQNRLCQTCLELIRVASYEAFERNQAEWLDWLHDETDNLQFSIGWMTTDVDLLDRHFMGVVRVHAALRHPSSRAQFDRLIDAMNTAARHRRTEMNPAVRAHLWTMDRIGEIDQVGLEETIRAFQEAQRRGGEVDPVGVWEAIGSLQVNHGQYEKSLESFRICGEMYAMSGLRLRSFWMESFQANAEKLLGWSEQWRDRRLRARDQALEMEVFNSVGMYDLEFALGHFEAGEMPEAITRGRSAVDAFRRANETWLRSRSLVEVAEILLSAGQIEEADAYLSEANDLIFPHEERLLKLRDRLVLQSMALK